MASAVIEEELTCPVCQDIFRNPVLLSCSHSFCKKCLDSWWRGKSERSCPVCKSTSNRKQPTCNLVLKNTCEAFLLERDRQTAADFEPVCVLHSEKLKLFCLDHNKPVCLVCRDSDVHDGHRFRPNNEVAKDRRADLQKSLTPLQGKLEVFKQVKESYDDTANYIQNQTKNTKTKIKNEFKRMRQFLQREEATRIAALKDEEKRKNQMVKERIDQFSTKISVVSNAIKATETEMKFNDVAFLQSYDTAVERVQSHLQQPDLQPLSGALIDEAKHLGNMGFNVWKGMKALVSHTPVVMDPNTAEAGLYLSNSLTRVSRGQKREVPNNPERFECHGTVMASEGYLEGTHNWVVEVADNPAWFVGVATEAFERKGRINIKSGLWAVAFSKGTYCFLSHQNPTIFKPKRKLWTISVILDLDRRSLKFFDPVTRTHIYSITHTWAEKLFPVFYTGSEIPLQILPVVLHRNRTNDSNDDFRGDENNGSNDN